MSVYQLDPLRDPRWPEFLDGQTQASIFHAPSWLKALQATYGYEPMVLTTTRPGQPLANGIVFCGIRSWLTGSRLVSLPFSDHCQPLLEKSSDLTELLAHIRNKLGKWKYAEVRPLNTLDTSLKFEDYLSKSEAFCFHVLDLRPHLEELFHGFHKSCIQRKISRATREKLVIEKGRSDSLLKDFYRLMVLTRRRHQLPPQPFKWFRNLVIHLGNHVLIRVVYKDGQPIAAILTVSHKKTVTYKYGCSDATYHNLGGMPFLFWDAIQDAKAGTAEWLDLGRSELDNQGLISFKDNWGATRSQITYYRDPAPSSRIGMMSFPIESARKAISLLPDVCLTTAGRVLYKHIG